MAGDKTGDISLRQNSMITLSTFPGAIKSVEQKIGTFGPQTERAGQSRERTEMTQQMSQGSHIKVHAQKGSSGGSTADNGLLSTKMREVRGWSFKDFPFSLSSQIGCFIYFWICDVKPASRCSSCSEIFASVTPVRFRLHSQHLLLPFQLGTRICPPHSIIWVVLDLQCVSDLQTMLKFLVRTWLQGQRHLTLLVMKASFCFPVVLI